MQVSSITAASLLLLSALVLSAAEPETKPSVESMLPAGVGMLRMLRRAQQPDAQLATASGGAAVSILLPDEPEYTLSFDPQSHLLTRARQADRAATMANASALDLELGDVRDWGALKVPGKATASRDGRKLFELNLLEFEPLERIESGTFRGLQ